jgi:hypothetical protein
MRTVDEIQQEIDRAVQNIGESDSDDRGKSFASGMLAAFQAGLRLVKEGKNHDEITGIALKDMLTYVSHGDDCADAWQSGYSCGLW